MDATPTPVMLVTGGGRGIGAATAATLGPITALVNNAGILERQSRVDGMTADRLHRVLATNVVGYFGAFIAVSGGR